MWVFWERRLGDGVPTEWMEEASIVLASAPPTRILAFNTSLAGKKLGQDRLRQKYERIAALDWQTGEAS